MGDYHDLYLGYDVEHYSCPLLSSIDKEHWVVEDCLKQGGLESCKENHNFKNYSIVLLAMVDTHYRFVWASSRFPSNSHDDIIFKATNL